MRNLLVLFICLMFVSGGAFAFEDTGKLTVVTDMDDAVIYIDGEIVGQNFVKKGHARKESR